MGEKKIASNKYRTAMGERENCTLQLMDRRKRGRTKLPPP